MSDWSSAYSSPSAVTPSAPGGAVSGNDIFPSAASTGAPPDEAAETCLRYSMANLLFQVLAILLLIIAWVPTGNVDWVYSACRPPPAVLTPRALSPSLQQTYLLTLLLSHNFFCLRAVEWFNGSPGQGQNVGLVFGDLAFTTIDSLGWNGAPFSWTDREEADIACAGPLVTSDVCMGLRLKITCNGIYDFIMILCVTSLSLCIIFTSWLVHQLRFGLVVQTNDNAMVGTYGCLIQETQVWRDPCLYIYFLGVSVVVSVLVGLPSWPISMLLMRDKFIGLGGLWWGGAQTIFGVQGVVNMGPGYEMFCAATVFLIPACIVLSIKMRDTYRALLFGGGVDASEDMSKGLSSFAYDGFSKIGGGLTGALAYIPSMQWGDAAPAGGGGGSSGQASSAAGDSTPPKLLPPPQAAPLADASGTYTTQNPLPWATEQADDFPLSDSPFGESAVAGTGKGKAYSEAEIENPWTSSKAI